MLSSAQVEVHRLVWFVGILAFTIAMILFVIGLIRKMDPLNAFVNGFILVVVANVPEVRMHTWGRHGPSASSVGSPLPRLLALITPAASQGHLPVHTCLWVLSCGCLMLLLPRACPLR